MNNRRTGAVSPGTVGDTKCTLIIATWKDAMKTQPNPNTILLPPKAFSLIQTVLAGLTENQMNPQVSDEVVCGITLIKITFGNRPDAGKIAKAMKEGKL